jgi:hypothetical protein
MGDKLAGAERHGELAGGDLPSEPQLSELRGYDFAD